MQRGVKNLFIEIHRFKEVFIYCLLECMATFEERKREARKILKREPLTQAELAKEMNISRAYSKLILGGLMEDGAITQVSERSVQYYAYSFRIPPWIRPALWVSGCAAAISVFHLPAAPYAVFFAGGSWVLTLWKRLERRRRSH